jgi:hypothetical protein
LFVSSARLGACEIVLAGGTREDGSFG